MIARPLPMLMLMLLLGVTPGPDLDQQCASVGEAIAEPVPYCELASHPEKYNLRLVLTEATWVRLVHAWALADDRCTQIDGRSTLALPSFPEGSRADAQRRGLLRQLEKKGGSARVDIIGLFHYDNAKGFAGPDGQRFQIEVKCLLSARPAK